MTVHKLIGSAAVGLVVLTLVGAGVIYATAKPYQRDRIAMLAEQRF